MKRKPWYLKGRTGEMLAEMRDTLPKPVDVQLRGSYAFITGGFNITVRGNARNRRQAARALGRYLNGADQ